MATLGTRDLLNLLALPTAPFRESAVVQYARAVLQRHRVPHFLDPAGNVVIGCASRTDYRKVVQRTSTEPVRLFVAHMDHPGFHGLRWKNRHTLVVQWHGGSPTRGLAGSDVWIANELDDIGQGTLGAVRLRRDRHAIETAEVTLSQPLPDGTRADTLFGGFRFRSPVWARGRRLYTKAADDLVGVHAILRTAISHFQSRSARKRASFLGLLTRGEEVGFVGAIAHFELGWLRGARRPIVCVSLETSRTLPGALVGNGPVVRLGDRRGVFSADEIRVISEVAERTLPKRHQRRIMDGGTCEATAALAYGLPAIGISVPLGNYHNEGFEESWPAARGKRGDRGPAPEFVHLDDIEGMCALCAALMAPTLTWTDPWQPVRRRLLKNVAAYRSQLRHPVQGATRRAATRSR